MNFPIVNATFNLTQQCNLRCAYCFTAGKTKKVMPFHVAKKAVNFLIKQAVEAKYEELANGKRGIDISFWGGEPLLEWELLKKIVLYAEEIAPKEISLTFGGTTNGVLLTPKKFDFLDKHKIYFMVSLDGTAETHDKYRVKVNGKGSHAIIIKNMKHILKKWPFYKVRTSPYPERIDHFYEDIKYLVEHKIYSIMFSPVYEYDWTDEHWKMWKEQCFKVVDLIVEYKKKGININIEHFNSYAQFSNNKWPCGAARFYCGIDTDGSIWPCHRFIKFSDQRPWQEKEMCIGHIDEGITKPELREQFIDFHPECGDCEYLGKTPCMGGCYAINFDLTGDIRIPYPQIYNYVAMQHEVSLYLQSEIEKIMPRNDSCICNNMCYLEGTRDEIIKITDNGKQCHCYNSRYQGDLDTEKVARPLKMTKINPAEVVKKMEALEKRIKMLESKFLGESHGRLDTK